MLFEEVSQNENFDREKYNLSLVMQSHKKRKCSDESSSGEEKVCCCNEGELRCIHYSLDKKPQDLKSILRTTRKYDEIACCDENKDADLCTPRVKFSPDLITEVIYREKVTISDRSMLFYSIREERKFAKEIILERQTATKLGLTWNEWINQNVE